MLSQREEMQAEKRLVVNNLQEKERHLTQELAHCKEDMNNLIEENKHLASQLNVYQDDLKAINEALVIKDAEVLRRYTWFFLSLNSAEYKFQNVYKK